VPIRTVAPRGNAARCGIGSGITSGSLAEGEWQEWRHKQAFLERASEPFELLETLALQAGELRHRAAHGEFVRFKTTRRAHYDAFAPTTPGVFDAVLWNAEGEITECTRGNVAMLIDSRWATPPLACGLPGVGRALAMQGGKLAEAVIRVDDLPRVQGWAFVNSLRGWIAAQMV
jgi:para-aminobenzoate synthetase / 4-amino-4-deoxychorismate lyase